MAVIITNGDTTLTTAGGFYRVEAHCLTGDGTPVGISTTRYIDVTFANPGNCQGVVLCLYPDPAIANTSRNVQVDLEENSGGSWVSRTSVILTPDQITNNSTDRRGEWILPFEFTPYAITTAASTWRFKISQVGGTAGVWYLRTSNGTVPFYATWCDTTASFTSGDTPICKDVLTINQTATFGGVLGTGETVEAVCGVICKSSDPTVDNVGNLVWENPPVASYTLTLGGILAFGSHSGLRIGSATQRIPVAQKAIIDFSQTPTAGTYRPCLSFLRNAYIYSYGGKSSLFVYGEIPTTAITTLAANASTGQKRIVTTDATGWAPGDRIAIGKQDVTGVGDTTIYTIDAISGTNIDLTANLATNQRLEGAYVIRANGYGVELRSGTGSTTFSTHNLGTVSNLVLSGVQMNDQHWNLYSYNAAGLLTAGEESANRSQMVVQDCSCLSGAAHSSFYFVCPNQNGLSIQRFYTLKSGWLYRCFSMVGPTFESGEVEIQDCVTLSNAYWVTGLTQSPQVHKNKFLFQNNTVQNASLADGAVSFSGIESTFYNNTFWGCVLAVSMGQVINPVLFGSNTYDRCTSALRLGGYGAPGATTGLTQKNLAGRPIRDLNSTFGSAVVNTTDISFVADAVMDYMLDSPSGDLTIDETEIVNTLNGSRFLVKDWNKTSADDRSYYTYGHGQRCGAGLADTTVRTAGGYSLRMQPTDSDERLRWAQRVPTGDIQNKTMTISVWVKINHANYYAGTHSNPTLTVDYDDGTEVTSVATDSTEWQQLAVTFVPATSYGELKVNISGATDASGSDAYFYVDDFNVAYPAGVSIDLGNLDIWADAMPVAPTIATMPSLGGVWDEALTAHTVSGSFGDKMKKLLTLAKFLGLK
jgi:hypothetical protein